MTTFQSQAQDDLEEDFNSPYDSKGLKNAIVMSTHCDNEPPLRTGTVYSKDKFLEHFKTVVTEPAWPQLDDSWHFYGGDYHEYFADVLRALKVFCIKQADSARNMDSLSGFKLKNLLVWLEQNERALKILSSFCLIFYGGCWRKVASVVAASEIFGTANAVEDVVLLSWRLLRMRKRMGMTPTKINKMVKEAFLTGKRHLYPEQFESGNDVTPAEFKGAINHLGLQVALMLAVLYCSSWAHLCLSIAFTSRTVCTLFVNDGTLWDKAIELSLTVCACLIFYCYSWQFVIALYMGLCGFSLLQEALGNLDLKVRGWKFSINLSKMRYYILGANCIIALWQSHVNYTGIFQDFSGLMLLLPLLRCWNLFKQREIGLAGNRVTTE